MYEEPCPYCGAMCEADWVDVGVGLVQAGPFHCDACYATEAGSYDSEADYARRDPKTGWYPPGDPPGSSANMIGGKLATVAETRDAYHARFAPDPVTGTTDYDQPGVVEEWWAGQRSATGEQTDA